MALKRSVALEAKASLVDEAAASLDEETRQVSSPFALTLAAGGWGRGLVAFVRFFPLSRERATLRDRNVTECVRARPSATECDRTRTNVSELDRM
eukprot:3361619-Pyramimonas_sp.AAC.1